jgi:hypothetical protein
LFIYKEIDTEDLVKRMMELWHSDPIHSFINLLKNLDNEYIDFDTDTQKLLNKSFTTSSGSNINATLKIDDKSSVQSVHNHPDFVKIIAGVGHHSQGFYVVSAH